MKKLFLLLAEACWAAFKVLGGSVMKIRYIGPGYSKRGELSQYDIKSLFKQAVIVVIGALIPVLGEWVTNTDWGIWSETVLAGWVVLANILRKAVTDYGQFSKYWEAAGVSRE